MEVCDDPAQVGASAEDLATWLKTAKNAAAKASLACHTGPLPPPVAAAECIAQGGWSGLYLCLHPASRGIIGSIPLPSPCSPPPPLGPGLGRGTVPDFSVAQDIH